MRVSVWSSVLFMIAGVGWWRYSIVVVTVADRFVFVEIVAVAA